MFLLDVTLSVCLCAVDQLIRSQRTDVYRVYSRISSPLESESLCGLKSLTRI